jgi:AAA domain
MGEPLGEGSENEPTGGVEDLIALAKRSGAYRERRNGRTRTWVLGHEITAKRLDRVGAKYAAGEKRIARDFIIDDEVIGLCGEEGSGKSWCAYQIAGELTYPEGTGNGLVLGTFELEQPLSGVMIIDFEQPEQDIALIRDEMASRRVLDPTRVHVLSAVGACLDRQEDAEWIFAEILSCSPEYLIFDTATEAVSKPREDESVRPLFTFLEAVKQTPRSEAPCSYCSHASESPVTMPAVGSTTCSAPGCGRAAPRPCSTSRRRDSPCGSSEAATWPSAGASVPAPATRGAPSSGRGRAHPTDLRRCSVRPSTMSRPGLLQTSSEISRS